MNEAPYGSKEWFLAQGEPEWRTMNNHDHIVGVVGDVHFTNDREPQLTAGPMRHYQDDALAVNVQLDHRLPERLKQHGSDGCMGVSLSPMAAMQFAADLFGVAHRQWVAQMEEQFKKGLKS